MSPRIPHRGEGPESIAWSIPDDEGPLHVLVIDCPPAMAPALLGWKFTPELLGSHAALWRSWSEDFGFEPTVLGRDRMEAYVARPPRAIEVVERLASEQFAFAPDFAQDDDPAIGVLHNVLGHRWSFWWD